jgi:hypothetical protein
MAVSTSEIDDFRADFLKSEFLGPLGTSYACTRGWHQWGGQKKTENPSLGGPGKPRQKVVSFAPTVWQGFPGPRGRPDSTNLGFPVFFWPPH